MAASTALARAPAAEAAATVMAGPPPASGVPGMPRAAGIPRRLICPRCARVNIVAAGQAPKCLHCGFPGSSSGEAQTGPGLPAAGAPSPATRPARSGVPFTRVAPVTPLGRILPPLAASLAALAAFGTLLLALVSFLASIQGAALLPLLPTEAPLDSRQWLLLGTALGGLAVVQSAHAALLLRAPWARAAQVGISLPLLALASAGGPLIAIGALAFLPLAVVAWSYLRR